MTKPRVANAEEIRISAFPKDESLLRISWFGEVAFVNRSLMVNQPSVLVLLHRFPQRMLATDLDSPISPTSFAGQLVKCWVSVGTLVLLRIGDFWQGQRLLHRPSLQTETFSAIEINDTTVSVAKAGAELETGEYLIPFSEHPWHKEATRSSCTRVDLADGRMLVIPAMELIRFYFGSSSSLLSKLFKPPLQRDSLYKEGKLNPQTGYMSMQLAEGINRASAEDIARIAGDRHAWTAALCVGASCLKASVRNEEVHPIARFPFVGSTDLQVHGQWLSRGAQERRIFLVHRIASCSHAFPFKRLNFWIKDPASTRSGSSSDGSSTKSTSSQSDTSAQTRIEERDASSRLTPHVHQFQRERTFPDLLGKPIYANRSLEPQKTTPAGPSQNSVSDLALGSTGTSDRRREAVLAEHLQRTSIPAFLKPAISACLQLDGVSVHLLTGDFDHGCTQPVELPLIKDGVVGDALLIEEGGLIRPRHLAAFLASKENLHVVLVFIESDPLYPLAYPTQHKDEELTPATLKCATRDFRGRTMGFGFEISVSADTNQSEAASEIRDWILTQLYER